MGIGISEEDLYVATLLDLFNLRFGPSLADDPHASNYGGVAEMAALQREFQIFREGRPFVESAKLLGLGGLANNPMKNWWFEQLAKLPHFESDRPDESGDRRIVKALITNLDQARPQPCLMRAHDGRAEGASRVLVSERSSPLFYVDDLDYLVISLPMRPRARARRE